LGQEQPFLVRRLSGREEVVSHLVIVCAQTQKAPGRLAKRLRRHSRAKIRVLLWRQLLLLTTGGPTDQCFSRNGWVSLALAGYDAVSVACRTCRFSASASTRSACVASSSQRPASSSSRTFTAPVVAPSATRRGSSGLLPIIDREVRRYLSALSHKKRLLPFHLSLPGGSAVVSGLGRASRPYYRGVLP
jgi:hypothetical protein